MAQINILDKSIFNRIAAGEVVEKPASVVKELVENSIDAGANYITVEIWNGGIKKIKVTDNGIGMNAENLPKAFMPHATSKVANLEDLEKIGTLGFRGEALSSICSVSKVIAISKVGDAQLGNKIEVEGGELSLITSTGAANGTIITVENLFYCVPARAKFLRRHKTEEGEITNIISRLILANPNITFKYVADDKIIYLSTGKGLFDAIYTVYGKITTDNLLPVNYKKDMFKISGFIGKPTFSKPNRTYQTLIINGRYVINQTVSTAVNKAYERFLMKGNFPFYVINLEVPLDKIDVNVHPNKLDVKFEDNSRIFSLFYNAIIYVLNTSNHIKTLDNEEELNLNTINQISNQINNLNSVQEKNNLNINDNKIDEVNSDEKRLGLKNISQFDKEVEEKRNNLAYFISKDYKLGDDFIAEQDFGLSYKLAQKAVESENINSENTQNFEPIKLFTDGIKIVGTIFNTYIIATQNNFIYFIDQHAAHERLLYDKFKEQLQNKQLVVQQMLIPYIINVNHLESNFINNNLEKFRELGFEIDSFGINSYKLSTVPLLFKDISVKSFFDLILKDINSTVNIKTSDILEDYIARFACRSAIKANDIISNLEIEKLLNDLNKNNQVLLCPHGRPIIVKISNKEIEKWFKRIV